MAQQQQVAPAQQQQAAPAQPVVQQKVTPQAAAKPTKIYNIRLSNNEILGLISNFSTMFSAGIPILETVDSLLEDAKGNQKKLLQTLRDDLTQGQQVHKCFAKFPNIFDKVTVNIIKAAEEAGSLDTVMGELKNSIKKQMEFNDKIKGAMIYPLFIIGVFVAVLLLMLTFVIPRISQVFLRLRVELPLPTKILIFVSDTILSYTIPVTLGIALIIAAFVYFYKTQRKLMLRALVAAPLISKLAREVDTTQFCHSVYLLLNAGIPITNALELSEDVVIKDEVGRAIKHAKEMVFAGKKLSQGLKDNKKIFPSIMIKIIEAGERSGSLDKSMQDISEYLDYEVSQTLKTVTALMEPIMLVMVGLLVGGMMLAIIAPIYGLIGQVGQR
jgi:type IV pilus assembly protein PilC